MKVTIDVVESRKRTDPTSEGTEEIIMRLKSILPIKYLTLLQTMALIDAISILEGIKKEIEKMEGNYGE